jgi:hypothetical protein
VLIGLLAVAFFMGLAFVDSEPSLLALYGLLIFVVGHTVARLRARMGAGELRQ